MSDDDHRTPPTKPSRAAPVANSFSTNPSPSLQYSFITSQLPPPPTPQQNYGGLPQPEQYQYQYQNQDYQLFNPSNPSNSSSLSPTPDPRAFVFDPALAHATGFSSDSRFLPLGPVHARTNSATPSAYPLPFHHTPEPTPPNSPARMPNPYDSPLKHRSPAKQLDDSSDESDGSQSDKIPLVDSDSDDDEVDTPAMIVARAKAQRSKGRAADSAEAPKQKYPEISKKLSELSGFTSPERYKKNMNGTRRYETTSARKERKSLDRKLREAEAAAMKRAKKEKLVKLENRVKKLQGVEGSGASTSKSGSGSSHKRKSASISKSDQAAKKARAAEEEVKVDEYDSEDEIKAPKGSKFSEDETKTILTHVLDPEKHQARMQHQKTLWRKCAKLIGGHRTTRAISDFYNRQFRIWKAVERWEKSKEKHTGGGDGQVLVENKAKGSKNAKFDDFSLDTLERFRDSYKHEMFVQACGKRPDVVKMVPIDSTQPLVVRKHPANSDDEIDDDPDADSNTDSTSSSGDESAKAGDDESGEKRRQNRKQNAAKSLAAKQEEQLALERRKVEGSEKVADAFKGLVGLQEMSTRHRQQMEMKAQEREDRREEEEARRAESQRKTDEQKVNEAKLATMEKQIELYLKLSTSPVPSVALKGKKMVIKLTKMSEKVMKEMLGLTADEVDDEEDDEVVDE